MKKTEFPQSALEIMQTCLEYFKNNSEIVENSVQAEKYLEKINSIMDGETVLLSSADFLELHAYVISIFSSILDKGKVTDDRWTDKQWDNVLKHIEKCYENGSYTFEVTRIIK